MCEICFKNEIEKFESTEKFLAFENELEQKLKKNDGLYYLSPSSTDELIEYAIYSCKRCSLKWYFQIPNTLKAGFFLREENAHKLLLKLKKSDDEQRLIVFGICITIITLCLLFLAI